MESPAFCHAKPLPCCSTEDPLQSRSHLQDLHQPVRSCDFTSLHGAYVQPDSPHTFTMLGAHQRGVSALADALLQFPRSLFLISISILRGISPCRRPGPAAPTFHSQLCPEFRFLAGLFPALTNSFWSVRCGDSGAVDNTSPLSHFQE